MPLCCWPSRRVQQSGQRPGWVVLVPRAAHRNVRHCPGTLGPPVRSEPDHSVVSPHKTWQGFVLGVLTTIGVAVAVLAPWLTPLADWPRTVVAASLPRVPYLPAAVAGLLIAVAGFFGDITMSALKRDAGVKDSSHLLPGQGGILDRIDSLTFAAPVFFYFVYGVYA